MRTSNPALRNDTFANFDYSQAFGEEKANKMTLAGTTTKTGLLLLITIAAAAFSWNKMAITDPEQMITLKPYLIGSVIGGFVLAMVIIFKKTTAPLLSPLYAAVEGFFLGVISALFNAQYPGIAFQAVCLTFGTLFCMLFLYRTGIIKVTQKFRMGVVAATGGIVLFYLVCMVMSMFGPTSIMYSSGPLSIGISVFIVIIAALNLALDFDFIEQGCQAGCPKYMEWYAAFSLLVTLVWLYLEILRLLSKLRR